MITMDDVITLEQLSKLALFQEEREKMLRHIVFLSNDFEKLAGIDTENAQPLIQVTDLKNVFREDVAIRMVSRDEVLANAPEQNNNYFQVPKTIE